MLIPYWTFHLLSAFLPPRTFLYDNIYDSMLQPNKSCPLPVTNCYNSIDNCQKDTSFIIWQTILVFHLFLERARKELHSYKSLLCLNGKCFKDSLYFHPLGSSTRSMYIRHYHRLHERAIIFPGDLLNNYPVLLPGQVTVHSHMLTIL